MQAFVSLSVLLALVLPLAARSKAPLSKPASRPPVYKKFDKKQKPPVVRWGRGKR